MLCDNDYYMNLTAQAYNGRKKVSYLFICFNELKCQFEEENEEDEEDDDKDYEDYKSRNDKGTHKWKPRPTARVNSAFHDKGGLWVFFSRMLPNLKKISSHLHHKHKKRIVSIPYAQPLIIDAMSPYHSISFQTFRQEILTHFKISLLSFSDMYNNHCYY